jgi:DNA-binding GntR family transcriptional regulator
VQTKDQANQERIYQPLQRDVLRDGVIEVIEKALFSGKLRPGDRVVETKLARQTGISRGPVREAIQQLVGEGVLVTHSYRGTFVAEWTAKDVAEVYGLRAVLEGYAVHLAMQYITSQDLADLEDIIDEMQKLARQGDGEGVSELDIRFHTRICELSQDTLLFKTLAGLRRKIGMLVTIDRELAPDLVELASNHLMLLEAIRTGDPEHTESVFREHIVEVGNTLVQRMCERDGCDESEITSM